MIKSPGLLGTLQGLSHSHRSQILCLGRQPINKRPQGFMPERFSNPLGNSVKCCATYMFIHSFIVRVTHAMLPL